MKFWKLLFLLYNSTYIEDSRRRVRDSLYQQAHLPNLNRFDTGSFYQNIVQRIGSFYLWAIPTPHWGNPYVYPQNPNYIPVYEIQFRMDPNEIDENSFLLPAVRLRQQIFSSYQNKKNVQL